MRTATFYLSFTAGKNKQRITLPGGGFAYIRVVESDETDGDAMDNAQLGPNETLLNAFTLNEPEPRPVNSLPILTRVMTLLAAKPFQTTAEITRALSAQGGAAVEVSTVSSLLYRDMIHHDRVGRREAKIKERGWEWYVV